MSDLAGMILPVLTVPETLVLLAVAAEALNDGVVLHTVLSEREHDNLSAAARHLGAALNEEDA